MYTTFQKKTTVNLITGSLGAGKTTLLRNFIEQKPNDETWGVLVNEFGAVGIDGPILSSHQDIVISQIPGGCICCTAQNELKEAIQSLLKEHSLDRLFIEPTGLGEPDTLVDLLQSDFFQQRFEIQSVFAVLDSATQTLEDIKQYTIMQNLLNMADVIVLNKSDLATDANIESLKSYTDGLYPAKQAVLSTNLAKIDARYLNLSHTIQATSLSPSENQVITDESHSSHSISHKPTQHNPVITSNQTLPGLVDFQTQNQLNTLSIGWIFDTSIDFDWSAIFTLFKTFTQRPDNQKPLRAKGVFKVGKPWMLFQWVNQQATREYIAYRRDSRIEPLLPSDTQFNINDFENALINCLKNPT